MGAKEKKPGSRKKKNPRIVLPEGPVPGKGKKNPEFERKKTRESYFQRAQSLAKEKKPGIRKKKKPRIVLPEGPVPGKGKKTRNSKEKKPANRTSRWPSPWRRKRNPEFERKKTRESYFQRAQSLAKEKNLE